MCESDDQKEIVLPSLTYGESIDIHSRMGIGVYSGRMNMAQNDKEQPE